MAGTVKIAGLPPLEGDLLTTLIVRWTAVVGKRSRGLLFPFALDAAKRVLKVAVPNSMVRAQYEPLLTLIVEKIGRVLPGFPVDKITLSVTPRHFENTVGRPVRRRRPITPDPAAVAATAGKLTAAGVPEHLVQALSEIAVMLEQRRHEDR